MQMYSILSLNNTMLFHNDIYTDILDSYYQSIFNYLKTKRYIVIIPNTIKCLLAYNCIYLQEKSKLKETYHPTIINKYYIIFIFRVYDLTDTLEFYDFTINSSLLYGYESSVLNKYTDFTNIELRTWPRGYYFGFSLYSSRMNQTVHLFCKIGLFRRFFISLLPVFNG